MDLPLRYFYDDSIVLSLLGTPFIHGDQANNQMHYDFVARAGNDIILSLSVRVIEDRLEQLAQQRFVVCSPRSYALSPLGEAWAYAVRDFREDSE